MKCVSGGGRYGVMMLLLLLQLLLLLWNILSATLHLVVPDPHPPSRPLPPPPREDRQQKPATPPTGAARHQQPSSAAPQPQQRKSHIFKPMVRSLHSVLLLSFVSKPPWNMETWPDKWTAVCRLPSSIKKRIRVLKLGVMSCTVCSLQSRFAWHSFPHDTHCKKIYNVHFLRSTCSQISNVYYCFSQHNIAYQIWMAYPFYFIF
jgi:hypothetical protein